MDMPADRRTQIVNIMGLEGQINRTWAEATDGIGSDTDVYIAEWELDLWDE